MDESNANGPFTLLSSITQQWIKGAWLRVMWPNFKVLGPPNNFWMGKIVNAHYYYYKMYWLEWHCHRKLLRMCHVTWPGGRGHPKPHIWNQRPQFAYSLYNCYGATMTIKGSLHAASPIVMRFFGRKCSKSRQKRARKWWSCTPCSLTTYLRPSLTSSSLLFLFTCSVLYGSKTEFSTVHFIYRTVHRHGYERCPVTYSQHPRTNYTAEFPHIYPHVQSQSSRTPPWPSLPAPLWVGLTCQSVHGHFSHLTFLPRELSTNRWD